MRTQMSIYESTGSLLVFDSTPEIIGCPGGGQAFVCFWKGVKCGNPGKKDLDTLKDVF